ncbi:hypothetical protein [Streptomyces sp. NPDC001919]
MTVKDFIAWLLVMLLARVDQLVFIATVNLVALPTAHGFLALGLTATTALLSALPIAVAAAFGVSLWWVSPGRGRRPVGDVVDAAADRVALWAGWQVIEPGTDES